MGALPPFVLFSLTAAFFFSLTGITAKLNTKYLFKDPPTLIVYLSLVSLVFLPFFPLLVTIKDPRPAFSLLALFSLTFFLASILMYFALFQLDASVFQPLFHLQTLFTTTLAFFLLGETFKPATYLWIGIIIAGGLLVGYDEHLKFRGLWKKPVFLLLTALMFFALSDIFAKKTMVFLNFWNFRFWSLLVLALLSLLLLPLIKDRQKIGAQQLGPTVLLSFFGLTASIFLFRAYTDNVTISQALGMFGSLFTVVIAAFLSRFKPDFLENHPPKVYLLRGGGVLLMLLGAMLITFNR